MPRLTYAGGRNTKNPYQIGISGELLAQTIEDKEVPLGEVVRRCIAETEMTVGNLVVQSGVRFWLVAVAAVNPYFPFRFFVVVCRDGEYLCSRELPKVARIAIDLVEAHRQARREASVVAEAIEVVKVADSKAVEQYDAFFEKHVSVKEEADGSGETFTVVCRDAVAQPVIVQDGFYTVSWADKHRTFHIETQPADARFAAGKRLIALLGKDGRYINFALVERNGELNVWRRFISCYAVVAEAARFLLTGDLASAGKMYAQQSGNCYRCGRVFE